MPSDERNLHGAGAEVLERAGNGSRVRCGIITQATVRETHIVQCKRRGHGEFSGKRKGKGDDRTYQGDRARLVVRYTLV